jgi:hypothetical protein
MLPTSWTGRYRLREQDSNGCPRQRRDFTARYLIEGRVVAAGDWLQIVLSLVDAETAAHLWGDAWSSWLPQPLPAIERAVAAAVGAVPSAIRRADSRRASGMRPQDMDAYQTCLRAYPLLAGNTQSKTLPERSSSRRWKLRLIKCRPRPRVNRAKPARDHTCPFWLLKVGVECRLYRKTQRTRSVKGAPAINRQSDPGHE